MRADHRQRATDLYPEETRRPSQPPARRRRRDSSGDHGRARDGHAINERSAAGEGKDFAFFIPFFLAGKKKRRSAKR
jgi:hypothetical protein